MHKVKFVLVALTLFFFSCAKDTPNEILEPLVVPANEIIKIPVVVHIITYLPDPTETSDEKVKSQIEVLNQDFRKKNTDYTNTPAEFIDRVADVGIEFYLATTDPAGNPTTGIIRTSSEVTGWDGKIRADNDTPIEDFRLYFSNKGGQDAWPSNQYLNIWVADLSDRNGNLGLIGYAQFPGVDPRIDGVVIDPRVFGTLPPLNPSHEYGRTATHEIGHWLNLLHIYGKGNDCKEGDLVDDTPAQKSQYLGTPVHPQSSCGSNDMFMNFMDRVNDQSMYMFTIGQRDRMRAIFNDGAARRELYLNAKNYYN